MHSLDFLFPRFLVFPPANPSNFSQSLLFSKSTRSFLKLYLNTTLRETFHVYVHT